MTRNYFERRRLMLRARAMAGVAARERKRMTEATAVDVVEVGWVTFDGPAFGGRHEIVLRSRTGADALLVCCDGRELRPRTGRGFVAMVGRMVWRRAVWNVAGSTRCARLREDGHAQRAPPG